MNKYVLIIIGIIVFLTGSWILSKMRNDYILSKPIVYGYESYMSSKPNSILAIHDLKDSTELRDFYSNKKMGLRTSFDFPLLTLPRNKPFYIMGYENNGSLMEIYCYSSGLQGGYFTGYVLTELTHKTKPGNLSD